MPSAVTRGIVDGASTRNRDPSTLADSPIAQPGEILAGSFFGASA